MVLDSLLIFNQDKSSRTMLRYLLEIEGYNVQVSDHLDDSFVIMGTKKVDMILLDGGLPEVDIEIFIERVVSGMFGEHLHVILLVPEDVSAQKAQFCKQLPISHQLQRPFSPRELIAMIRRCFNNAIVKQPNVSISSINVVFDDALLTVDIDGQLIKLAKIEFALFRLFLLSPNKIYSRKDLLRSVWGVDEGIEERTVDVHIRRLRRALKVCGLDKQLQTVHGAGYRLAEAMVSA